MDTSIVFWLYWILMAVYLVSIAIGWKNGPNWGGLLVWVLLFILGAKVLTLPLGHG